MKLDKFEELKGQIVTHIDKSADEMVFTLMNGDKYKLYHSQDCCESVSIEDVIGDLDDLLNTPILSAEEVCDTKWPQDVRHDYEPESYTWTFYKLATIKGSITIRWYGSSNGYYSEHVSFGRVGDPDGY